MKNLESIPLLQNQLGWTYLTNHTHVLVCLARKPDCTVRELALQVGVTERSIQRILSDLEEDGAVRRIRDGRRNRYDIDLGNKLRHPLEAEKSIGQLLEALA